MIPVSAIIVTRGDADLTEILDSLPAEWERVVWTNGDCCVVTPNRDAKVPSHVSSGAPDLSVYGRYAAIEHASHDLIYVADDDVIVSDPQKIVDTWDARDVNDSTALIACHLDDYDGVVRGEHVVCNQPPEFRHDFYLEHALVGFGAAFHRDAPFKAFDCMWEGLMLQARERGIELPTGNTWERAGKLAADPSYWPENFLRTCDVVFTALTPRILVDVPVRNLPWASDDNRMWKQPTHVGERQRMLDLVLKVRDVT